ncbi:histone-lysine N-methyltransferase SUVR5 isoform X3 [Carex rostrata]
MYIYLFIHHSEQTKQNPSPSAAFWTPVVRDTSKWRGKWQTGIRCPRGDCPSLTLSAKPTHDRKTYIAVFFPRSKAYSWVDTLLVRPINDSPMPLVNGTHSKWRKMVDDLNIPRSHAMQKLALAMLNLTDSLHSQAVIEDARKTETWKSFAMEASCCKSYADLGELLVRFCNMILPDYISSNWLKDSFDSWVQRCRSVSCAKSFETLMEELVQNVLWTEMDKLHNGFMQPEVAPEWKTIKQDVTKWFAASREDTKRPIGDGPVSPDPQISRKRPKLEIRRASTSCSPHEENAVAATTPVSSVKQVEVIKPADPASASSATPKGYSYRQCAAFIETKGRQCERWANDGDVYCCVHLNVRVDAYDRRAPVDAPLCRGTTTNGTNCKHRAKPGSVFCKKHRLQPGADLSANIQTNIVSSLDIISFSNKLQDSANSPLSQIAQSSAGPSTSIILSPTFGQTTTLIKNKLDSYNNTIASPTNLPRPSPKPTAVTPSPTATHALTVACNSSSALVVSASSSISVLKCIGERFHPHEVFTECQEAAKKFDLYCQNHIPKFLKRARDGRSRPITKEVIIKLFKSCTSRQEKLLVHRACELLYSFLKSKLLIRRSRLDPTDQTDLISNVVSNDPEVGQYLLKLILSEKEKLSSIWGLGTDLNPLPGNKSGNTNIVEQGEGSNQNVRGLKCKICFQEFFDDQKLGLHWTDVHKKEARSLFRGYACAVCMEGFSSRKVLESHVQEKHGSVQALQQSTLFRCRSCNCHFPSPDQLWQHVLSSHVSEFTGTQAKHTNTVAAPIQQIPDDGPQKFTCKICGLKFDLLPDLGRHHQEAHMDNTAGASSSSFTHRRGKYQLNRTRHLLNQQQPSFKFKKNQTSVKNSIKLTISNQTLVQDSVDTETTGLRQLTDEECSKVAQALFSGIHKSKPHPSNSDILSVARSTCCKVNLITELEAKFGSLPDNIYLKAAKLCSETDTRIEWHQEGFLCPKGCKAIDPPALGPLSPIGEPLAPVEVDFEEEEYHVVLDSKHFGWSLKRDGIVLLCGDVSFGKEKVAIPCVLDEKIRDSLEGLEEKLANGISTPWKEFSYVTERVVDPSLEASRKDKGLGCGCVKERCSQESCDHVYLFDNDYENALNKCGKPMLEKFAYDGGGLIVLEEGYPVYECNSSCKCNASCQNRVLQKGIKVKLEVFMTISKGWGVRAVEAIPGGTFVCEYVGEVVNGEQASERRERQSKDGCEYLCEIEAHLGHAGGNCEEPMACAIDASKYGNVARFINHSCSPNLLTYLVLVESMDCQLAHVGLFAKRDIEVGEELVFDYRCKERDGVRRPCFCGSPSCRGRIN